MAVMEGGLDLLVSDEALEHYAHHAHTHTSRRRWWPAHTRHPCFILAHPPIAPDPGNRALDDPAASRITKPCLPWGNLTTSSCAHRVVGQYRLLSDIAAVIRELE
jgi:hypothetical protein